MRDKGVLLAIEKAGGVLALARIAGVVPSVASRWTRIPAERVFKVSRALKIAPKRLRPDLFRED